jgi:hypothetical protein
MAESHVSPVCMSTWLDLPFKVFPAFGPEPTAENSLATNTTPPTSRAFRTLMLILV